MVALDLHEVEILALIKNLGGNVVQAIERGAHAADPLTKVLLKNAAFRMHQLASALPDPQQAAENQPPVTPECEQQPEGDTAARPASEPAGATKSEPAGAEESPLHPAGETAPESPAST